MRCDRCGLESEIKEAFITVPRSGRITPAKYCPVCWKQRSHRYYGSSLTSTAVLGVTGLVLALAVPETMAGWLLLNLFGLQVMLMIAIAPHEFGHALVARALGMRVYQITIGCGRALYERRWNGFLLRVGALPYGGFCYAMLRDARWYRLRWLLMILAGPLANLLLAAAVWPWAFVGGSHAVETSVQPATLFVAANALVVVWSLWPHRFQSDRGLRANDGLLLIQTLFSSKRKVAHLIPAHYCAHEGAEACRQHEYHDARKWFERGLEHAPDNWALLCNVAIVALRLGELEDAHAQFSRLLEKPDLRPAETAMLQNNIAYTGALAAFAGREEFLLEADELSAKALETLPWNPSFKGTRGTVLGARGLHDEGTKLLREAMAEHTDAQSKADNACILALLADRHGSVHERDTHLTLARQLDPGSLLLATLFGVQPAAEAV